MEKHNIKRLLELHETAQQRVNWQTIYQLARREWAKPAIQVFDFTKILNESDKK